MTFAFQVPNESLRLPDPDRVRDDRGGSDGVGLLHDVSHPGEVLRHRQAPLAVPDQKVSAPLHHHLRGRLQHSQVRLG